MGRRRSEMTDNFVRSVADGMQEFIEALQYCSFDDGQPTEIKIHINGKESDTITMKISNPKEFSNYIKLNLP